MFPTIPSVSYKYLDFSCCVNLNNKIQADNSASDLNRF